MLMFTPNSRSFFHKHETIAPPQLTRIHLLYSEEELWIRLQIREFVFRFGEYFDIDGRATASLQNVQGNWRLKRLAVNLAWQLLTNMENGLIDATMLEPPPRNSVIANARTIQQMGARVIHEWMEQYGLNNNKYLEKEAARVAFVENLERDGLSADHWEDLIDILRVAGGCTDPPEAEQVVHSSLEEFRMLQLICDMLLMHSSLRRTWVLEEPTKELQAMEAELRVERRRLEMAQTEDKGDRLAVEKKYVDVLAAMQRNTKRFAPAGRDSKGNEYWIFNDLVTYGNDARNSELYWGHGVVAVGPGFSDAERRWWYIADIDDIVQLRRWLIADRSTSPSTDDLIQQLTLRAQYLRSLQWIVQVQGSSSSSNRRGTRA
ncbi:hypothetical protein BJV82DRAFT_608566 [Fennellomyces sp. T-0311]|nr:hypothetical protein BJV82DRAFT_608566 [Fennellomyces sp. T-0311]